jgi:predicted RNase H-like nuclease
VIRLPDRPVAGVDGCPGGWLCVAAVRGEPLSGFIAPTIGILTQRLGRQCLVAIDMPIGLPIDDSRRAESDARAIVGPRRSSVFPVPLRVALDAGSRTDACRLQVAAHRRRKRIGVQTWSIVPKIREVDAFVRSDPATLERLVEIHPEVSFRLWKGMPLAAAKKSEAGRRIREELIDAAWPGHRARLGEELRARHPKLWAFDDLNDAFAALWSAIRVARGTAKYFPHETQAEIDGLGIPMRIVG